VKTNILGESKQNSKANVEKNSNELLSGGAKMAAKEKGKITEAVVKVGEEMEALEVALGEEVKEAPRADMEELKEHVKEKVGLKVGESDFPLERASEQARQAKAAIRVAEELKRNETTSAIVEAVRVATEQKQEEELAESTSRCEASKKGCEGEGEYREANGRHRTEWSGYMCDSCYQQVFGLNY
jgi:hypothetical protein